jgi:hypothetical protein
MSPITIVPVETAKDGSLSADLEPIFRTKELITVDTLDAFDVSMESVRVGDTVRSLKVYRDSKNRIFALAEDLVDDDAELE